MSFEKNTENIGTLFLAAQECLGLGFTLFFEKVHVSRPLPGQSKEWLEKVEELQQTTRPGLPTQMSPLWFGLGAQGAPCAEAMQGPWSLRDASTRPAMTVAPKWWVP